MENNIPCDYCDTKATYKFEEPFEDGILFPGRIYVCDVCKKEHNHDIDIPCYFECIKL